MGYGAAELDALVKAAGDAVLREAAAQANDGEAPNFAPGSEDEQGRLDRLKPITCPNCGHEFQRT